MNHLVIAGSGEFGRELYWTILGANGYKIDYDIKGYIDDDDSQEKISLLSAPFLGTIGDYIIEKDDVFTCAIANPKPREKVINRLLDRQASFISIIHKTSIIHGNVKLGEGLVISPYTVIGDSSIIGDYVVLNGFSGIGHDSEIDDFSCIMSHCDITGHSHVGRKAFLAGGVRTIPGAKIGEEAYVGSGSVVLKRVKPGTKVFGNPAKEI